MPPNAGSQVFGDLTLASAANPTRHGKGKLSVPSDVLLTSAADTPQVLKSTLADLSVSSAKNLTVSALAGNLNLVASEYNVTTAAVNATSTLAGKDVVNAALGLEHLGAGSSFVRTSAGALDVAAQAGTLTASGYTSAKLSSATGDVFLEATAAGKMINLKAPTLNVDASTVTMLAGGNYSLTSTTGYAATQAANDVRFSSTSGDISATVTDDSKKFLAVAKNVSLGKDITSTTVTNGHLTVKGNLTVSGTTTAIDTINMTVKDNLIQLTSAPGLAGRFPGLIMARHATDHLNVVGDASAAFVFDEAVDRFKLGYTGDSAESGTLALSRAADLQVEKLYCSDVVASNFRATSITVPGSFATKEFSINGNSLVAVIPEPTLAHYGSYDMIVVGPDGGSHGSWRISKSASASASFVSIGAAIQGETQDELISVDWPANSPPVFKHAITKTNADIAPILYKLRYLTI